MFISDFCAIGDRGGLLRSPDNNTLVSRRIDVINFFSYYHQIAVGENPEGLRREIYNACTSEPIVTETNKSNSGLRETTGGRFLYKMLMIAESVYNVDIYDRLYGAIKRLENWKYNESTNKFIAADVKDYCKAHQELWAVILKMTNLLYKPSIFGHFLNVKLKL